MPNYLTTLVTRRRGLAAAVLGSALVLPAGLAATAAPALAATSSTAAAATTRAQVARFGAGWLADQITANGGFVAPSDASDTAYAVLGLHAAGVGQAASAQAIAWLETQLGTALEASDGNPDPGKIGYDILAAVSAGVDPRPFGGTAPANDLVARLLATSRTTGSDAGLFGAADPSFDGSFRQGTALAALKAAGVSKATPAVAAGLTWLAKQQCADGLWESYRSDTTVACPAADPNTFAGPDTNSTSMAVQGLAAYHQKPGKALVLKALRQIQSKDGGFPFIAAKGQSSDPDSTALSIQTILAEGASPAGAGFTTKGATPYDALASYQLGCGDPVADRGAFYYPFGTRAPSLLATVQAVPAAAGVTFPLAPSTPSTAVPHPSCSASSTPAVASGAWVATAKLAGTAGSCAGTKGVTVAVDFTAFAGTTSVRCDSGKPATGVAAMQGAGFTPAGTTQYGLAFVCRINNLPSPAQQPCISTPPTTAYWSYYHASKTAKKWTYSTTGASTYKPAQGSIEAWAFGNGATPSLTPAQVRATHS